MKKLLPAIPLALFPLHALAVDADKAAKSGAEPVAVLLFLGGVIVAVAVLFFFMAKSGSKQKKDAE